MHIPGVKSVLVLNPKGGCGKTIIATNLAAYYATRGLETVLMDCDRQGSALHWHELRSRADPPITATTVHDRQATMTRAWAFRMPTGASRLVIDSPAGVQGFELADLIRRADYVIVPILPSALDMHATLAFLDVLSGQREIRNSRVRIGVVANRVDERTNVKQQLLDTLLALDFPLLTRLRDTQNYVFAAGLGKGIHELRHARFSRDQADWDPVINWIDHDQPPGPLYAD